MSAREALFDAYKPWATRPTPAEANDLINAHRSEVLREAAGEALAFSADTENASTWETVGNWLNRKAEGEAKP